MSNSYFHFKQFSITNMQKGLKVTTDACLLGALATHANPMNALDIGTGSGLLSLMIAQKYPSCQVLGVEMEYKVYLQACENINNSKFKDQISIVNADIVLMDIPNKFDLIICNPPFYKNHLESNDKEKNSAIHQTNLSPNFLANFISKNLNYNGIAWVIYPKYESNEFKKTLKQQNLYLTGLIRIFNKPNVLFREVLKIQKENTELDERTILIKDVDNINTDEFNRLMKDYYL